MSRIHNGNGGILFLTRRETTQYYPLRGWFARKGYAFHSRTSIIGLGLSCKRMRRQRNSKLIPFLSIFLMVLEIMVPIVFAVKELCELWTVDQNADTHRFYIIHAIFEYFKHLDTNHLGFLFHVLLYWELDWSDIKILLYHFKVSEWHQDSCCQSSYFYILEQMWHAENSCWARDHSSSLALNFLPISRSSKK